MYYQDFISLKAKIERVELDIKLLEVQLNEAKNFEYAMLERFPHVKPKDFKLYIELITREIKIKQKGIVEIIKELKDRDCIDLFRTDLINYMNERNLSIEELAKETKVSVQSISDFFHSNYLFRTYELNALSTTVHSHVHM